MALATFLRVLAIGLPSVLLFVDVDPTDLADGLGQVVRLPARFVLEGAGRAALIVLLREDWRYLGYARRARGVADHARLRRVAGMAFALLVIAIRRGSQLSTAMEARGFGAYRVRTWVTLSELGFREYALIAAGSVVAIAAVSVSVVTGEWNLIGTQ